MSETKAYPENRNRDLELLRRIAPLKLEMEWIERQSDFLMDRLTRLSPVLSDMPRGGGVPGGMEGGIAALVDMQRRYARTLENYADELSRAEAVLNGIANMRMRVFVRLVYVDARRKADVMRLMRMSKSAYNTARGNIESAESLRTVFWPEWLNKETLPEEKEETPEKVEPENP